MNRRQMLSRVFFVVLLCLCASLVASDEASATETTATKDETKESTTKVDDSFDASNEDWGSYYDPQNIFCGKYDCYKILGFDYESFGKVKPSKKEITKRYRSLSREWHPDKSKHKNAKERFVKIARAYEILNDEKQKKEYDDLRYDQEAYFRKYGTSVLWSYAPKSDVVSVVLVIFLMLNGFSYFLQYNRWQRVADRFIQASVQEWGPKDGGSDETKAFRDDALKILAQREETNETSDDAANGKKAKKLTAKEKKRKEQEQLFPIVKELVYNEKHDFGAGFHKPTYKDLLVVQMFKWPIVIGSALVWQLQYTMRRLSGQPLSDSEKTVLTQRAVGNIYWSTADDAQKEDYVKRELWVRENYVAWKDELEFNKLPAAEQKMILKEKKRSKAKAE